MRLKSFVFLAIMTSLTSNEVLAKKLIKNSFSILRAATQKYYRSEMTVMKTEKTVKSELMGTENKFLGNIAISKGLFRWENTEPEKSLLVFDGQTIWSEQGAPKEFPGPAQVVKARVDKKNKSQVIIGSLLGGGELFENFNILGEKIRNNEYQYTIEPKNKDLKINTLNITVLEKTKEVTEISYVDDVGNTTTMKFSKIEFNKKKNKKLFKYVPPKDAQVTNL
jgi:outer membrane lipoprotein carrier protein